MKKLTKKREAFCVEFCVDKNGTKAAIRAGFSERTASQAAYNLLQLPEIQARIDEILKENTERCRTTVELLDSMHKKAYDVAKKNKSPSVMTTAARNLGDLHGINKSLKIPTQRPKEESPLHEYASQIKKLREERGEKPTI